MMIEHGLSDNGDNGGKEVKEGKDGDPPDDASRRQVG